MTAPPEDPRDPRPVPHWGIGLVALIVVVGFLASLIQDVGRNGRTWLGWIDTTAVTTTDFQRLLSPDRIVYPADFPPQFRLDHLPEEIDLQHIDSLAVYRQDDNVIGYSVRGHVVKRDGTEEALKAAVDVPGYQLEFWLGADGDKAGDIWIKWDVQA